MVNTQLELCFPFPFWKMMAKPPALGVDGLLQLILFLVLAV